MPEKIGIKSRFRKGKNINIGCRWKTKFKEPSEFRTIKSGICKAFSLVSFGRLLGDFFDFFWKFNFYNFVEEYPSLSICPFQVLHVYWIWRSPFFIFCINPPLRLAPSNLFVVLVCININHHVVRFENKYKILN